MYLYIYVPRWVSVFVSCCATCNVRVCHKQGKYADILWSSIELTNVTVPQFNDYHESSKYIINETNNQTNKQTNAPLHHYSHCRHAKKCVLGCWFIRRDHALPNSNGVRIFCPCILRTLSLNKLHTTRKPTQLVGPCCHICVCECRRNTGRFSMLYQDIMRLQHALYFVFFWKTSDVILSWCCLVYI
jgi:hypothetical protein